MEDMEDNRESPHPKVLQNQNPAFFGDFFENAVGFLENYGWYVILGIIGLVYLKRRCSPHIDRVKAKVEQVTERKVQDPEQVWQRQQRMDAHRRRLQEEHDAQAARFAEQQKLKEEEKRQSRIEDWDRHQEGKGYRSKVRQGESQEEVPATTLPSRRPVYRTSDYNPLTGAGGGGRGFRPPPRQTGGG